MSTDPNLPQDPQAPPPPPPPEPRNWTPVVVIAGLVVVGALAYWLGTRSSPRPDAVVTDADQAQTSATGAPVVQSQKLEAGEERWLPAAWVDVNEPAKVQRALEENAWLQEVLQQPLGRGFAGSWGAFLGSKGEDLDGKFKGAVAELFASQVLTAPYRLIWFSGSRARGVPALLLPAPSAGATAALATLDASVKRGEFTETACPGPAPKKPMEVAISRWLVAEHSLYGGSANGRTALARSPLAVLQALCSELPERGATADIELNFAPEVVGREAQTLSHVLGFEGPVRLGLSVEGTALTPRGIMSRLAAQGRLDSGSPSPRLLELIPAEAPVVLTAQLKLPRSLDAASLQGFWSGASTGELLTRQVSLVWSPRGNPQVPTEVALIWSRPEDEEALKKIFSGANKLATGSVCGHLVLASHWGYLAQFTQACEGRRPSLANAAPAVVSGLKAKSSLTFGIALGTLLSQLTHDGYQFENGGNPKSPPPEIEQARRSLEQLPYVGFTGRAEGDALVPGGFKS